MVYLLVVFAACLVAGVHTYLVLQRARRDHVDDALLRQLRLRDLKEKQHEP